MGLLRFNVASLISHAWSTIEVLRIGADKVSIEPDEVDLAEVVRDCVEATLDTAKEASIEMEQVADDSIPVRADATRMRQV